MSHESGTPVEAGQVCRFAWAVGGRSHVCRQGHGHALPHKCGYCGEQHAPPEELS
ncbi:hypothetical protein HPO96_08425 [Kribbella sandramycini]|uniref:Uncharacterized protein n=1 Tax=Kribbella sandramycini TaxID=60450 RepID=A0A7Y4KX32_9ACTN|nr:hypothetical protein [Kribbella sandramycini]MBB6569909.1 hypothetical protein [Kribbella sandramycini]NOL40267.1 hypothetical protein [Kribbella sandramycini]